MIPDEFLKLNKEDRLKHLASVKQEYKNQLEDIHRRILELSKK